MAVAAALLHRATQRALRKVRRTRRFNKERAARPLANDVRTLWRDGVDALFAYLTEADAWDKIARHAQAAELLEAGRVAKALSDRDRDFIAELLARFGGMARLEEQVRAIMALRTIESYEAAAQFGLGQLGVSASFTLRDPVIRQALLSRVEEGVLATRRNIESVMGSIVENFYELGRNPYDREFLASLDQQLRYEHEYQVKRFALTETAIAAERGVYESWQRNGVTGKRWKALGQNTRESHAALDGVVLGIDEEFNVGGYPAQHPADPQLPPEELINCHCWSEPVVDDNFALHPARIWEGR